MPQHPRGRLLTDAIRIRSALAKLDLCELVQDYAPELASKLLREAQDELQRLIDALSPEPRQEALAA